MVLNKIHICIHQVSINWPQTLATCGQHSSWDMCHVTAQCIMIGFLIKYRHRPPPSLSYGFDNHQVGKTYIIVIRKKNNTDENLYKFFIVLGFLNWSVKAQTWAPDCHLLMYLSVADSQPASQSQETWTSHWNMITHICYTSALCKCP